MLYKVSNLTFWSLGGLCFLHYTHLSFGTPLLWRWQPPVNFYLLTGHWKQQIQLLTYQPEWFKFLILGTLCLPPLTLALYRVSNLTFWSLGGLRFLHDTHLSFGTPWPWRWHTVGQILQKCKETSKFQTEYFLCNYTFLFKLKTYFVQKQSSESNMWLNPIILFICYAKILT